MGESYGKAGGMGYRWGGIVDMLYGANGDHRPQGYCNGCNFED